MSDQRIPISQLSETQTAPDASYIAIDDGSLTKKITVENFNSTSTASAQQYANQAAASAQTVEDNIATSAAQIREATLAAREATQASTAATASATSAYDSASLAQNYSANAATSAGQAMNAADTVAQGVTDSKEYAEDSEAWAVGKRNGTDVPSSDVAYHNNAKYYSDNATTAATSAASDADRAEAAAESINVPDTTLTVSGVAAESKATGDRISSVNTELVDIRVMANGNTAATAGDAVRDQVGDLKNALDQAIPLLDDGKRTFDYTWGNIQPDGSINYNYKNRIVTADYEKFNEATPLSLETGYGAIIALYNDDYSLISRTVYAGGNAISVPANTYYRACVYHGTIVPSSIYDLSDKLTYESNIQKEIDAALTAALAITNAGIDLTAVDDLNTTAAYVIGGDRRVGFFRYTASTSNIPNSSSGFVIIYRAGTLYQTQIAIPTTGGLFARNRLNGVWNTWNRIDSAPRVYRVEKDGSGDFTSLVDAINEATQYMDSKVYVGAGEWDIIEELGETYLNNVSSTRGTRGPYLKNRIHLIFASNSKVVCNYTGAREDTMRWLSPFNAGIYGFTLENANIEVSNCRYCVHDERDTDTDAYVNKYINCRMHIDNSTNTVIRTCNPIGGGLGKNGYIDIDGCWFKGEPTQVYVSQLPLVTYHNSAGADSKSHISVKNTYLADDGRFRFNWYGQSQLITDVEVSGCSMGSSILSRAEVEGSSPYVNISITEWNNIVRP